MNTEKKSCHEDVRNEIPEIKQDEAQAAMDSLTKGKASDNNGIRAEDIKTRDDTRQIFNEVLKQEDCTPETWRRTRVKVIYKKGSVEEVGKYRPICTLPSLYKLFSTTTYDRLYSRLDQAQSEDQGGFRRSCQTLDHLATCWNRNAGSGVSKLVATVDLMKAFDSNKSPVFTVSA